jgi:hypothetical protein
MVNVQNTSEACFNVPPSKHCEAHLMFVIFMYRVLPVVKLYLRHQHAGDGRKEEERKKKNSNSGYWRQ